MNRTARAHFHSLLMFASFALAACQLHRPATAPSRTLEPQLLEPQLAEQPGTAAKNLNAGSIRLLSTESRGNIGRRVLHRQPDGELIEDAVWKWSTPPERYLDTALRLEVSRSPQLRLVDAGDVPALGANLLVWNLETSEGTRLVGTVEFEIIGIDGAIHTQIVRGSELVSGELPGDLAAIAGRLMQRLASEGLRLMLNER